MAFLHNYRRFFYLVSPNETFFENVEDVPDYVNQTFPLFASLLVIENTILWLQGRQLARANDGMSSVTAGLMSLLHSLLFRPVELTTYLWVFSTMNVVTLPWNSPWTWLFCMVGTDFGYYWVHRLSHEVNIMWAAHQTHHSSEDYNLTTALRQSAFQKYVAWVFYLPLAVAVPPSVFLVHQQFNLLYQFWVHTEVVDNVGWLEYIICTPSHHRVHHGRNPYCIDKNYGGVFIVWDRLFGTFQAERKDETIAYGLVETLNSWCPIYTQIFHAVKILCRLKTTPGFENKMAVLWKGPGWSPGLPRLGISPPVVKFPVEKYDRSLYTWASVYVWTHLGLNVLFYLVLATSHLTMTVWWRCAGVALIILSLTSFGALYDNKWYAVGGECGRCVVIVLYAVLLWSPLSNLLTYLPLYVTAVFSLSSILWLSALLGLAATQPFPNSDTSHQKTM